MEIGEKLHNEHRHNLSSLTKYYNDNQIKENAVGGACGTYGRKEIYIQDFDRENSKKETA